MRSSECWNYTRSSVASVFCVGLIDLICISRFGLFVPLSSHVLDASFVYRCNKLQSNSVILFLRTQASFQVILFRSALLDLLNPMPPIGTRTFWMKIERSSRLGAIAFETKRARDGTSLIEIIGKSYNRRKMRLDAPCFALFLFFLFFCNPFYPPDTLFSFSLLLVFFTPVSFLFHPLPSLSIHRFSLAESSTDQ